MKKLLAWSSIGHAGYMLVGLCCGSLEGLQGFILYLVVYIVMTVSLFAIALLPLRRDFMDKGLASPDISATLWRPCCWNVLCEVFMTFNECPLLNFFWHLDCRLSALEEMSGMEILASDKTGTLTLNR